MPRLTLATRNSPRPRSRRWWWTTNGWLTLDAAIHGEMDRVSQQLTQRVKELAERYDTPLPQMVTHVAELGGKGERVTSNGWVSHGHGQSPGYEAGTRHGIDSQD